MNTESNESTTLLYGCFDGLRGREIAMTLEQAQAASHAGECYGDCAMLSLDPEIMAQFASYDDEDLRNSLAETGGWSREELADMETDELRIKCIWMAACDIRENNK